MAWKTAWAILLAFAFAGCHQATSSDPNAHTLVRGKGRLLSVDQTLGMGTLDIKGKTVSFWWNNELQRPGSEGDPEVRTTQIPFNANVGDMIYFQGLENKGTIFITGAATERK